MTWYPEKEHEIMSGMMFSANEDIRTTAQKIEELEKRVAELEQLLVIAGIRKQKEVG